MSEVDADVFVTVRMPLGLREEMETASRIADRTLAAEIRIACRAWLTQLGGAAATSQQGKGA